MATVISEAELLDALAVDLGGVGPAEARTMAEIKADTGVGEKRLRRAMRLIQQEGRLDHHLVVRRSITGAAVKVHAYTILPKKPPKRKR